MRSVALSADGGIALTGSYDRTARLWDTVTRKAIGLPLKHGDMLSVARFSQDGKTIITTSYDRTARLWVAATGERHGPPLPHRGWVIDARFSPDRKNVVTGSTSARLWRVTEEMRADLTFKQSAPSVSRSSAQMAAGSSRPARTIKGASGTSPLHNRSAYRWNMAEQSGTRRSVRTVAGWPRPALIARPGFGTRTLAKPSAHPCDTTTQSLQWPSVLMGCPF